MRRWRLFFRRGSVILGAVLLMGSTSARADAETDRRIEDAAASSYNFRAVLQKQITVRARDGVVTLTGTVRNREEKALAEDTVRGLPGVVSVDNQLDTATPEAARADGWIEIKLRALLLVHAKVSAAHTRIAVHDGVVTLTGRADTPEQRALTETYARGIEGVKAVVNRLDVPAPGTAVADGATPAAARPPVSTISIPAPADDAIAVQVKRALLLHGFTGPPPSVEARDGVVVLRGAIGSEAEKTSMSSIARGIPGVSSVTNRVVVGASE